MRITEKERRKKLSCWKKEGATGEMAAVGALEIVITAATQWCTCWLALTVLGQALTAGT